MDGSACDRFFREPTEPTHRRFEALRAVFVDNHSMQEVAERFGYSYGAVRNMVSEFRAACDSGAPPPFSSRGRRVVPLAVAPRPKRPRLPTRGAFLSFPVVGIERGSLASISSCRCWRSSASTPSLIRRNIPARGWSPPSARC